MSEHANTREHVSEHSCLSGWVILSILAHLAHLAQFYYFLIFSGFNTYNRFCSDWGRELGENWPMLMTFFFTAIAAIAGIDQWRRRRDFRDFNWSPCCRDTVVVGTLNFSREKRKKGKKEGKERKERKRKEGKEKKGGKGKKVKERKKGKGKLSVYQLYFLRNYSNHKYV